MRPSLTFAAATALAAALLSPLVACAQPMPGHHPAYLHALTDLRTARWLLYHQPGDARVYADEDVAIAEVDAAIGDIKRAAYDDGKNLNDHPAVDVPEHGSRLLRAIETLRQARQDISREEDNPEVRDLRRRSLDHLDRALHAAEAAHRHWLQDNGR